MAVETIDLTLRILGTVVSSASIAVTAFFAIRGLEAWRTQLVGKRQFEVAEQALAAFIKAMSALAQIRGPGIYEHESKNRPPNLERPETPEETRLLNTYYATMQRVLDRNDAFDELSLASVNCRVHFGDKIAKLLDVLMAARHKVVLSARMLIDTSLDQPMTDDLRKLMQDWKRDIWDHGIGNRDPIWPDVEKAFADLQLELRPYLK